MSQGLESGYIELMAHVPRWHACVAGPGLYGEDSRTIVSIDLIVPDRETVEEQLWQRVVEMLAMAGWMDPDPDEWECLHLQLRDAN